MSSPKVLNESQNNSTIAVKVEETLKISLPSNPTTGYSWNRKGYINEEVRKNPSCNNLRISSSYQASASSAGMCGSGGTAEFTVTPLQPGNHELVLIYIRPWEPENIGKTYTVHLNCSA